MRLAIEFVLKASYAVVKTNQINKQKTERKNKTKQNKTKNKGSGLNGISGYREIRRFERQQAGEVRSLILCDEPTAS